MYKYLNLNPSKRRTIDCVIRGVSFVTGLDWETVFLGISVECIKYHDMPEMNYVWASYPAYSQANQQIQSPQIDMSEYVRRDELESEISEIVKRAMNNGGMNQ